MSLQRNGMSAAIMPRMSIPRQSRCQRLTSKPDTPIKYESPYTTGHVPLPTPTPEPLKRPRTPDDSPDSAEKRQRVETATAAERRDSMNNLAAIIARAAATASQQVTQESSIHTNPGQNASNGEAFAQQPQSYQAPNITDPSYGMRILSLPILESLVWYNVEGILRHILIPS